jgi:hypothetical protein
MAMPQFMLAYSDFLHPAADACLEAPRPARLFLSLTVLEGSAPLGTCQALWLDRIHGDEADRVVRSILTRLGM